MCGFLKNTVKKIKTNIKIEAKLSSDLFFNILGIRVKNFKICTNFIIFNGSNFIGTSEFSLMCKEWALSNQFTISSELTGKNNGYSKILDTNECFFGENESVAVIIATNWIVINHLKGKTI
jgi:hypothetical protein